MNVIYNIGDLVNVCKAYVGNGQYACDGAEGIHTVVGTLNPHDYYLARGDCRHNPTKAMWDKIVHTSRLSIVKVS